MLSTGEVGEDLIKFIRLGSLRQAGIIGRGLVRHGLYRPVGGWVAANERGVRIREVGAHHGRLLDVVRVVNLGVGLQALIILRWELLVLGGLMSALHSRILMDWGRDYARIHSTMLWHRSVRLLR